MTDDATYSGSDSQSADSEQSAEMDGVHSLQDSMKDNEPPQQTDSVRHTVRALLDKQDASGRHVRRKWKDVVSRYGIGFGGVAVIIAVVMIFFYLFYVVFPIFSSAHMQQKAQFDYPVNSTKLWGLEEYGEIAFNMDQSGQILFFDSTNGAPVKQISLELPPGAQVTQTVYADQEDYLVAAGLTNGQVLLFKLDFKLSYENDKRNITPHVNYPFGTETLDVGQEPIFQLSATKQEDFFSLVTASRTGDLTLIRYELSESFVDDGLTLEEIHREVRASQQVADFLLHSPDGYWVYVISRDGTGKSYQFLDDKLVTNESSLSFTTNNSKIRDAVFLLGGISLLIADESGRIGQWLPVRNESNQYKLVNVRSFEFNDSPIISLTTEWKRKGFAALNENNEIALFFSTSHRKVYSEKLDTTLHSSASVRFNSRSNKLMILNKNDVSQWDIDNEHPDLSWSALWSKVWYENYPEPQYIWQSSASNNDFEAKFSLMPLSFGTLKAAFYAMLFAMPLAICGAIFTAYFMASSMRQLVKPSIEIMEALPTVILGFLAGLWLAPMLEQHLPGIFLLLITMPIGIILFGLLWHVMPGDWKHRIPAGWQAALLIPVIILVGAVAMMLSYPIELAFFNGNMGQWLSDEAGIDFDQRNSLVVGIAMGFAVIPTIFSIAEDAIFSVPRHLTNGSLALGASPWQTLVRVVLPTASPGIFSGVMIGMGRAVGETMIVLMATGNTPIMDANIFEGMRTLSANIAVEMPESEVNSSHYRILFLSGLVLFIFTFMFNTIAELVRHRLRKKYGSL